MVWMILRALWTLFLVGCVGAWLLFDVAWLSVEVLLLLLVVDRINDVQAVLEGGVRLELPGKD